MPTVHDVARLAGVSIKTVSNVVNAHPNVRPETRARVQDAIDTLGYRPNLSARSLRSGRSDVIGLVVPELSRGYFAELADAVIARADTHGLTVQVEKTDGDRARELTALTSPRARLADGIIFSPLGMGQQDAALLATGSPVVLLGERIFDGPVDHVTMRNVEAARAATSSLLAAGRRRIAVVGATDDDSVGSATLRLQGYRAALDEAGVAYDSVLVGHTDHWHRAGGASVIRRLLDDGVRFDAVFALNDALALGVLRALNERGLAIPREVAVVGFDNIEEAQYSTPSLTTIDPGRTEIATHAVDLLVARIRGDLDAPPRRVAPEFSLVSREST